MTGKTLTHQDTRYRLRTLPGIILIFFVICVSTLLQSVPAFADTQLRYVVQDNCPAGAKPDSSSILIVLLDRSGSLVAGNEPTDPNGYSGSATKALADLWPGQIAVIPFGKNQEPIVGPYAHSDISGITSLKQYIDNNPPDPNANTPLRPAMDQAKKLFSGGIPACSKLVLITDGVPDAPGSPQQEVNAIESQEIGWFHDHGLPISVFGLKIDKSTPDGQMADGLLNAIETRTGAGPSYDSVQSANNLGSEVTSLYAKWRGLSFTQVNQDTVSNTYSVAIDPSVDQATIISFYEQGVQDNPITKNGQAIPQDSFQQTKDQHYEIDNILDPAHNAGTYVITTVGNKPTSVYSLVDSSLTLQLVTPTATTIAYTGQKLLIQAHFLSSGTPFVTGSPSPLSATVKLSLNGSPPQPINVSLYPVQGSDLFTGYYLVPGTNTKQGKTAIDVGNLSVIVTGTATFHGTSASRGTSTTTIQVDVPKAPPPPPPPPYVCKKGAAQCFWEQYHTQIIIVIPAIIILLLLLLLLWWLLTTPFVGSITNIDPTQHQPVRQRQYDEDSGTVATIHLGEKRTFMNRLLHRSVISSTELQNHKDAKGNFSFEGIPFQLIAGSASQTSDENGKATGGKQRVVILKPTSSLGEIAIKRTGQVAPTPDPVQKKTTAYGGDSTTVTKSGPPSSKAAPLSVTAPTPLMSGDIVRISGQDNFQYS